MLLCGVVAKWPGPGSFDSIYVMDMALFWPVSSSRPFYLGPEHGELGRTWGARCGWGQSDLWLHKPHTISHPLSVLFVGGPTCRPTEQRAPAAARRLVGCCPSFSRVTLIS